MIPTQAPLFGLTLFQPWASLVADGLKPIENRPWGVPYHLLGCGPAKLPWIAVHAGKTYDHAAYVALTDGDLAKHVPAGVTVPAPGRAVHGAIIGVARIVGCVSERILPGLHSSQWSSDCWVWVLDFRRVEAAERAAFFRDFVADEDLR